MTGATIAAQRARFTGARQVTDDTSVLTLKTFSQTPLLTWQDGGQVGPGLFAAWDVAEGGRRWTFHIAPGARFHDGKPFIAADVLEFVDGVTNSIDMFGMRWSYARYLAEARLTAPDDRTLVVENPTPFADILDIFAEFHPAREDAAGHATIGTGAWRVAEHAPDEVVVLEHLLDPARRLTFRAMPRAEDRLAALRAGQVDAAMNLERVHDRVEQTPDLRWLNAPNTLCCMFYLNCATGIFANPAARLAANLAVDRAAIVRDLFHGLGVLEATVVSPAHLGFAEAGVAPHPHDPDAARRLLAGLDLSGELLLRTPEWLPEKALDISRRVAADLAAVGLRCRIEVQTDRPEYAREVGRKIIGDLAIFDSSPCSSFRVLNDKISAQAKGVWWQGHADPEAEALITAANRTVGEPGRAAAYGAALRRLHADPPWLYLFHPVEVAAFRPGAGPFTLDARGVLGLAP